MSTVTQIAVYCKIPMGLKLTVDTKTVVINGAASSEIVGGYGKTFMEPEVWEAVKKTYAKAKWLVNGHVYAAPSPCGDSRALEQQDVKSGFERISGKDEYTGEDVPPASPVRRGRKAKNQPSEG